MSNSILTTTNSKLDTRVKEPSGVVPPPSGPGSLDCFSFVKFKTSTSLLRSFLTAVG